MHSQNDEEQIIERYFRRDNQVQLSCLDIGANDGITLSNTYACVERGWSGVMVEPSKTAFEKLSTLYKDCTNVYCVNVAISDQSGEAIMWESGTHLNRGDTALLSSLKQHETIQWKNETFEPVTVQTQTFQNMIDVLPIKTFDLISIDVEGLDYEVLSQINLNNIVCRMLIVENNNKDEKKFVDYCKSFRMQLLTKNFQNLIFVRK